MKIVLLEPFFGGSHKRWALGVQKNSRHEVDILSLPGRHWKWRMHGAAVSLARQYEQRPKPDLILATDMLDLSTFLGLIRHLPQVPLAIYFHENQLTYPWSPADEDIRLKRDNHYAWINYTSALIADKVFFNSAYHRKSFLEALPNFLKQFPDHNGISEINVLEKKCVVLPLGMNLPKFHAREKTAEIKTPKRKNILWNHRWEYDKNPNLFFHSLFNLAEEEVDFGLIVTGEQFKNSPKIFAEAKERLADRIIHFGFVESKLAYQQLLNQADVLPVTSNQDFFGGSVVEAVASGLIPLLPNRLAYPEHVPKPLFEKYFYSRDEDFVVRLKELLQTSYPADDLKMISQKVMAYDWSTIIKTYDQAFQMILSK